MDTPRQTTLHDPVEYLPYSTVTAYARGQIIYGQDQPATSIYLLIEGKVKISRLTAQGKQVLMDIYRPDEFFGESSLFDPVAVDTAVAIEDCRVMTWTCSQVEEIAIRQPKLAIALMQMSVRRLQGLSIRIDDYAHKSIEQRLVRALLHFSERFGSDAAEGWVEMIPLTHTSLAEYVGTSRELITNTMTTLRERGLLRYSRSGITINHAAMTASLTAPKRQARRTTRSLSFI